MRENPPYLRVADLLRQRVLDQEWAPGDRLPSRAQLAEEFDVGENVVRRAQELLIAQGVLEGRAGSGTYVTERQERVRFLRARDRAAPVPYVDGTADLVGWESRSEAKVPAPADIAVRLGLAEGDLCVRTAYEFLADGQPVQLATSWEPYDLTAGTLIVLPEGGPFSGRGVVARMAEIGVAVVRAVEVPEPGQANAEEATLLGVQRGALVTRIQRTYYSDDGRPVETADIVVPAARSTIVYEVPVTQS
ncbi:GntR family transcriptional regulator [Streptomyces sp. NPDC057638]|uniref:GntR family transcriptional regulator n=1 Tax=Streptomyces sp. NPDC057638 TaxID=3346190 RepID=UPI003674AE2A